MNLELHNVKEGNSLNLAEIQKQHFNMQKDKVGLNIFTIQYILKGSFLPETALIKVN